MPGHLQQVIFEAFDCALGGMGCNANQQRSVHPVRAGGARATLGARNVLGAVKVLDGVMVKSGVNGTASGLPRRFVLELEVQESDLRR